MNCLRRRNLVVGFLSLVIIWVNTQWVRPSAPVGSASCATCHRPICDSHRVTAHFLSSMSASAATIKGSFRKGRNRVVYNDRMEVVLEKKATIFLQTAYFNGSIYESEAFDVVIGSGRKGQSYLYWDNNRLFQLPVSYYTPLDSWCNSPGYPTNIIYFNKQVPGECMECHATSAHVEALDNGAVGFDKSSMVYGIDCERCHGSGDEHVAWHTAHPGEKVGHAIVTARLLDRQQRLDACALCHSGFRREIKPPFSFKVGDTLDKFSVANYAADSTPALDVHGNQYGLLTSSKCFRQSQMDCSSCHDVHLDEHGQTSVFSQRCMNCHAAGCTLPAAKESTNCIDCHMPALPSKKILLQLSGKSEPVHDLVRTHRIAIYPEISQEYLEKVKP